MIDNENIFEYDRPIFNQFGKIIGIEHIESNFPIDNLEVLEKDNNEPITIDDVLDMTKLLKSFNGNFIKLLE